MKQGKQRPETYPWSLSWLLYSRNCLFEKQLPDGVCKFSLNVKHSPWSRSKPIAIEEQNSSRLRLGTQLPLLICDSLDLMPCKWINTQYCSKPLSYGTIFVKQQPLRWEKKLQVGSVVGKNVTKYFKDSLSFVLGAWRLPAYNVHYIKAWCPRPSEGVRSSWN